jgi:hypothetical protein
MKLNSVIFHTSRLKEMRDFYEDILSLSIGTFEKDGKSVPDFSDSYVNYDLGGDAIHQKLLLEPASFRSPGLLEFSS